MEDLTKMILRRKDCWNISNGISNLNKQALYTKSSFIRRRDSPQSFER